MVALRSVVSVLLVAVAVGACASGDPPGSVVTGAGAGAPAGPSGTVPSGAEPALDGCGDGLVATVTPVYPDPPPDTGRSLVSAVAASLRQRVGSGELASGIEELGARYEARARRPAERDAATVTAAGGLAASTEVTEGAAAGQAAAVVTVTDDPGVVGVLRFAELASGHWSMVSASVCAGQGG